MTKKVADPALLQKLNASAGAAAPKAAKKVTDPALLEQLHGDNYAHPDDIGTYVQQGMSGLNEGLADFLSLPADAAKTLLSIGPTVVNALGGHAAMPDWVPDPGQHARDLMTQVGAIKPEVDSAGPQIVRRIGREIGRNAIPVEGSVLRAAQPLRTLGAETLATLGSGTGAAVANQVAPGNPVAEMAGQVLGGGTAALTALGARKAVTPFPASAERTAAAKNMAGEGVTLTAGQQTGSRGLKYAESELGGGAAANPIDQQGEQFTRAALKRAGISADRATPEVINRAYEDIGNEFDDLAAQTTLKADRQLAVDLADAKNEFDSVTGEATRPKAVDDVIADVIGKVKDYNGAIPGDVYKSLRSRIDTMQRATKSNPELKNALSDVRNALDDAVERELEATSSPILGQWQDVRGRYRNLLTISNAAVGGGEDAALGLISPARLRQAVASTVGKKAMSRGQSDLGELARNGQATMTPLPQSGTAPRLAVRGVTSAVPAAIGATLGQGAMPGMGAVLGGIAGAAVPAAVGRIALSRAGRAYLGNQIMRPRLDPRGAAVGSGVTMTLDQYVNHRQQEPLQITVSGGAGG